MYTYITYLVWSTLHPPTIVFVIGIPLSWRDVFKYKEEIICLSSQAPALSFLHYCCTIVGPWILCVNEPLRLVIQWDTTFLIIAWGKLMIISRTVCHKWCLMRPRRLSLKGSFYLIYPTIFVVHNKVNNKHYLLGIFID